jgi:hypothetical protein
LLAEHLAYFDAEAAQLRNDLDKNDLDVAKAAKDGFCKQPVLAEYWGQKQSRRSSSVESDINQRALRRKS